MKKTILFVDDERQVLRLVTKLFLDSPYDVLLADSGKKALQLLANQPVNMVVSDMRMPEMDGYALLRAVKKQYPDIIRIILSGYSDERIILNALQNNLAKIYMFKPWQDDAFLRVIAQVFQTEEDLIGMKLFEIINSLDDLPTRLKTYNELTALISEDADIEKLAAVIENDPAIATRVLRIVNSAFYGTQIGSVQQAITYLGLINVRNIVLTSSIYELAPTDATTQKRLNLLSRHSTLTSRIMVLIYEKILHKKPGGDILSAGLLHDIGKLVTLNRFPKKFEVLFENNDLTDVPWQDEMEKALFGATHTDIGAYLLNWWGLPYCLSEASRYHHEPDSPGVMNRELVSVIHLADCIAWELNGIPTKHGISPWALRELNLSLETLRDVIAAEEAALLSSL